MFFGVPSPGILIFAFLISILAGVIKGVVGFALPTVLVSGLGSVVSAEVALAGMILPTLVTNGWQALRQGMQAAIDSVSKFKTFLISGFVVMMLSAQMVPLVPGAVLLLAIGILVTLFVGASAIGGAAEAAGPSGYADAGRDGRRDRVHGRHIGSLGAADRGNVDRVRY